MICPLCGYLESDGKHGIVTSTALVCRVPMLVQYPSKMARLDGIVDEDPRVKLCDL